MRATLVVLVTGLCAFGFDVAMQLRTPLRRHVPAAVPLPEDHTLSDRVAR